MDTLTGLTMRCRVLNAANQLYSIDEADDEYPQYLAQVLHELGMLVKQHGNNERATLLCGEAYDIASHGI